MKKSHPTFLTLSASLLALVLLAPAANAQKVNLNGIWTDSENHTIRIYHYATGRIVANMQSPSGQRFWKTAEGTFFREKGIEISLTFDGVKNTGAVRNKDLIGWSDGSTWSRGHNSTRTLTGYYKDNSGHSILVSQDGTRVNAKMLSPQGQQFWRQAQGTFSGDTLVITFPNAEGKMNGKLTGSVIKLENNSTWTKEKAGSLSGTWRDSEGHQISVSQQGNTVHATMLSPQGQQIWRTVMGTKNGNKIIFPFQNADGRQVAVVRHDNLLVMTNGSNWVRTKMEPR